MQPRHIGLLRLSSIGDVIHALPLAHGLKAAHPRARLTWVVEREAAPLLRDHPVVDGVVVFPRHGGPLEWWRFARDLRACRFDATVDPQGNLKSGLVGLLSGAALRAGLHPRDCKEVVNALLTNRHGRPARGPHGVERAWAAGRPLGASRGPDRWGLRATGEERAAWRERCTRAGADPDGPLLAMHLTDPEDARSWTPEAWAAAAAGVVRLGYQAILNGTAERAALARELRGPGVFDLTGRDDLRGLLAQFECMAAVKGNLLLSPDSGPLHLAVAAGLFVLCLSGPQDPRRTGPRRGASITAWEGLACAPCLERACVLRPPTRDCMRRLDAQRVLERISALAAQPRPAPSSSGGRARGRCR